MGRLFLLIRAGLLGSVGAEEPEEEELRSDSESNKSNLDEKTGLEQF